MLIVAPLAGIANAQTDNTSLLTSTISAAQNDPGNIAVGKTWTYRMTFRNLTFTGSYTFSQKITSIKNVTDWNGSTQECYALQTKIDVLKAIESAGQTGPDEDISKFIITMVTYLNTSNFSNPKTTMEFSFKYKNGSTALFFIGLMGNETLHIYKFPLSDGLSWLKTVNASVDMWMINAIGTNSSMPTGYWDLPVNASVAGPVNVTVPAGTFETYQINYTNDAVCFLFGMFGSPDQVQTWYSLKAQNFVKYFYELGTDENVTIELISKGLDMMLLSTLFIAQQQQQGFTNLLLIIGGITGLIIIAAVAVALLRRRG